MSDAEEHAAVERDEEEVSDVSSDTSSDEEEEEARFGSHMGGDQANVSERTKKKAAGSITRAIKCGIIGDGTVGKTTLLVSYTVQAFLDDYVPTLFDNFSAIENVDGQLVNMILWDTAGQEDYTHLRTTCYQNTDIFLLCFSTVHLDSFDNLKHKWLVELKANAPETPYILVGTKTDLRDIAAADQEIIDTKKGNKRAKELKALNYVECSAKNIESVNNVFREAIRVIMDRELKRKIKERKAWKKEEKKTQKLEARLAKRDAALAKKAAAEPAAAPGAGAAAPAPAE
eukprot:TRINITY_DN10664_c0_g1_i1.p1 TRINITY_DN10664_c0_g1~~TRINITY_DN10664_c0_g1_i1.p1  ORF type:complete len:287 (+),score=107.73 TRINITY_DN10664_c0_g1_i1:322-1182(+)